MHRNIVIKRPGWYNISTVDSRLIDEMEVSDEKEIGTDIQYAGK